MGHSLGGRGVTQVSYEMYKRYSKDYFNKLVIFSGGAGVIYPSKDSEMARNYFSHKPVKGFGEPDTATGDFFEWINKAGDYRVLKDADHGSVIEKGMLLDENNDKVDAGTYTVKAIFTVQKGYKYFTPNPYKVQGISIKTTKARRR